MFRDFTNQNQVTKTVVMGLNPTPDTLKNIKEQGLVDADLELDNDFQELKGLIDEFHQDFIGQALAKAQPLDFTAVAQAYKQNKVAKGKDVLAKQALQDSTAELRKALGEILTGGSNADTYDKLFKAELISGKRGSDGVLQTWLKEKYGDDDPRIEWLARFKGHTGYLNRYHKNRENIYSVEEKANTIPYRVVNQNLLRYIDNMSTLKTIQYKHPSLFNEICHDLGEELIGTTKLSVQEIVDLEKYNKFITQEGITAYNTLIGGIALKNGRIIEGVNIKINQHNQSLDKQDKIPTLKPLYKQILSDKLSLSFIPNSFKDDKGLVETLNGFHEEHLESMKHLSDSIKNLRDYNLEHIFLNKRGRTQLSSLVYSYNTIQRALRYYYNQVLAPIVSELPAEGTEAFEALPRSKQAKVVKEAKDFCESVHSTNTILKALDEYPETQGKKGKLLAYFDGLNLFSSINAGYSTIKPILLSSYEPGKQDLPRQNGKVTNAVGIIRAQLNHINELYQVARIFRLDPDEVPTEKDDVFFDAITHALEAARSFNNLYNASRSYLVQRPDRLGNQYKLNFGFPKLAEGWDANKEKDYGSGILRKDGKIFLYILNKKNKKVFDLAPTPAPNAEVYEKMFYKYIPTAAKMLPKIFVSSKQAWEKYGLTDKIFEKYQAQTHTKGDNFVLEDCHALIDHFKQGIKLYHDWDIFNFKFSDTKTYQDISGFYNEVDKQAYKVVFETVDAAHIDRAVKDGHLYLFEITSRHDRANKGAKTSLFHQYFKALFSPQNLDDTVYKLSGQAELFYRPALFEKGKTVVHPAGEPIANKNPLYHKKEAVFDYDIIKDRRYTKEQFSLHLSMVINFKAEETNTRDFNLKARKAVRDQADYFIGIDRGERNLIYVSVIDKQGKIVEQKSLNLIETKNSQGFTVQTDYHRLLNEREQNRLNERKEWLPISSMKDLKKGYIGYAVKQVVDMMVKYQAPVFLGDLSGEFINSRCHIEKQSYQLFARSLISKLNLLIDKEKDPNEVGGLFKALQLTPPVNQFKEGVKQFGFVFFVTPAYTSSMDPATGFVNYLRPKYTNLRAAKNFWSQFEAINYDADKQAFVFKFNSRKFDGPNKNWVLTTAGGERWVYNKSQGYYSVDATKKFGQILTDQGLDYRSKTLLDDIVSSADVKLHQGLMEVLWLILKLAYVKADETYILSPALNKEGKQFDSRQTLDMPTCADANAAYHLAKKGLFISHRLEEAESDEELLKVKTLVSNEDWWAFAQADV